MIKQSLRLLSLGAGVFLVAALLLAWDGLHDDLHKADYAVVFATKVEAQGGPSTRMKARLDRTLELYHEGLFPAVIVSGSIDAKGVNEAAVMKKYLIDHGLPVGAVIEDAQGLTTFDTAKSAARILRENKRSSVLIVSQYFHISRFTLAMKRCGVTDVYSTHVQPVEWRDLYSIPPEVLGYLKYFIE